METLSPREIVDILQKALLAEIGAAEMYADQSKRIEEAEIASAVQAIGEVEAEHVKRLAARVRALGGDPTHSPESTESTSESPVDAPEDVLEMLRRALEEEHEAILRYARSLVRIADDEATLDVLEENLFDEIRHARWLKEQIHRLSGTGKEG